ncbi:MAG: T9SS type A sorting domain-containing protein [Candidatus Cloacimonetes bacterium]|nr:T9SS type A sorting domain-containing protein [Candidatus Cloacimonadota bacterium]
MDCINRVNAKATRSLYSITWNGTDKNNQPVSSGIYFYKLKVNNKTIDSRKMIIIK